MTRLSEHFDSAEFRCRCCGRVEVAPELVERLEQLRALVGRPLVVVSGWRCPAHNARVGGARGSRHLEGKAVDLQREYATVAQAREAGFTGIGRRGVWALHVDVRPGRPATWTY